MKKIKNDIGRYMIGLGAVLKLKNTGKILLLKRHPKNQDFQNNQWELMYGRIDQFEEFEQGLKREIKEETGIQSVTMKKLLSIWHIYRGNEKIAKNELFGFTFLCTTTQEEVQLSDEHSEYQWLKPEEALELVKIAGIKRDIQNYIDVKNGKKTLQYMSLDESIKEYEK